MARRYRYIVLLFTIGFFVAPFLVSAYPFQARTTVSIPAGAFAFDIVGGDFDGDGNIDLATANLVTQDVSILLGNGDGTFGASTEIGAGTIGDPWSIDTGDFNNDDNVDLILIGDGSDFITLYTGDGTGGFATSSINAEGNTIRIVDTFDLDGDGYDDFVVSDGGSIDQLIIFLSNGDGTFATSTVGMQGPYEMAFGDVDGDTNTDIVSIRANVPPEIAIPVQFHFLTGNGDGTFNAPTTFNLSGGIDAPADIDLGDLDGDGDLDVVLNKTRTADDVVIVLGDGAGDFATSTAVSYDSVASADFLSLAYVDSDSDLDIITVNTSDGSVGVFLGNTGATFDAQRTFAVGSSPFEVVSADFNGDGVLDVATVDSDDNTISILLGGTAAISTSATDGFTTTEGGTTDTITVTLDEEPTSQVDITITSTENQITFVGTVCLVPTGGGAGVGGFAPCQEWDSGATFVVSAVDNSIFEDEDYLDTILLTASSSDGVYDTLSATDSVTITDNDNPITTGRAGSSNKNNEKDSMEQEDSKEENAIVEDDTIVCLYFTEYARFGDDGLEVQLIQSFLIDQGYYNGVVNGFFDSETEDAVKLFQETFPSQILSPWVISDSTGYWYKTTRKQANRIMGCEEPPVFLEFVDIFFG